MIIFIFNSVEVRGKSVLFAFALSRHAAPQPTDMPHKNLGVMIVKKAGSGYSLRIACFLSQGRSQVYFLPPSPLQSHQPQCEAMPRRTHRGKAESSGAIHPSTSPPFSSLALLLTGIESAATHVSDQVQPASSVSKLQAPGKPTESTFIAGDPVTECVIHYSLICTPYPHPLTHPTTSPIQPWGNSTA